MEQSLQELAHQEGCTLGDPVFAMVLDRRDPLRQYRSRFQVPGNVYLCGNSLGPLPRSTRTYLLEELDKWADTGVGGHFGGTRPWFTLSERIARDLADVVGAREQEVVPMNGLTVNLHLLMVSFYRPTAHRHRVLMEHHAFPSDAYAVASQVHFHGYDPSTAIVKLTPRPGEDLLRDEDILDVLEQEGDSIALVLLPGVQYYTGQALDIQHITAAARRKGCLVGWDLAHAVGNLELYLHEWDVDFACWCSYKYLNSGPGTIAGVFIHERHATDRSLPRFAGWWGQADRFAMDPVFTPQPGAWGWQVSNAPALPLICLFASLEIFREATMPAIRRKSLLLTAYLEYLLDTRLGPQHVQIISPRDPMRRGCQLSLTLSYPIDTILAYLQTHGVICDVRKPNVMRVAPAPLYTSFEEVQRFVDILCEGVGVGSGKKE